MRLAFTGSQGTGKTSLIDAIEKDGELGPVVRPPSTARRAMELGYQGNRDADPLSQVMMLISNINKEYYVDPMSPLVISDRTPIDNLGYTFYQVTKVWKGLDNEVANFYWQQVNTLGLTNMAGYDEVFYFPPYFTPAGDGIRDTDREYQLDIDYIIKSLIDYNEIDVHVVPDCSIEERVVWFKEVIKNADI